MSSEVKDGSLVKGIIVSSFKDDPDQAGRVQVYIPSVHGEYDAGKVGQNGEEEDRTGVINKYPWAQCITQMGLNSVPSVGKTVWIIFENNNPRLPVVVGLHTAGVILNDDEKEGLSGASSETGISGGSLAEIAASIIFSQEGSYTSVNWNDNGAISIGKIQWHANNARDLLKDIRNANVSNFDNLASGTSLVSDLNKSWENWKNYSSSSPVGKALKNILATDESKKVQNDKAIAFVQNYIDNIKAKGMDNPQCIVYLADIANQGPAYAYDFAARAKQNGKNDIDSLHNWICNQNPYRVGWVNDSRGIPRRNRVYNAIKDADSQGKFTPNNLTNMSGEASMGGQVLWPVIGSTRITQHYTYGKGGNHAGLDIGGDTGSNIIAVADGVVRIAQYNSAYGNYVCIYHEQLGVSSLYAHGNTAPLVNVGQNVKAGHIILKLGSTGNSTGPHCHFAMCTGDCGTNNGHFGTYAGGKAESFDPEPWIKA